MSGTWWLVLFVYLLIVGAAIGGLVVTTDPLATRGLRIAGGVILLGAFGALWLNVAWTVRLLDGGL